MKRYIIPAIHDSAEKDERLKVGYKVIEENAVVEVNDGLDRPYHFFYRGLARPVKDIKYNDEGDITDIYL